MEQPTRDRTSPGGRTRRAHRRPSVQVSLALLVLVPTVASAVLIVTSAWSSVSNRRDAETIASNATALRSVALASADLNAARVPASAVSYAEQLGVRTSELSKLLHVDFASALRSTAVEMRSEPAFSSTPALTSDLAEYERLLPSIEAGKAPFATVDAFFAKFSGDIDADWHSRFEELDAEVNDSGSSGSLEVQVTGVGRAYDAFIAGGDEVEFATFVLEGQGGATAREGIVGSSALFSSDTDGIGAELGPSASALWNHFGSNATVAAFDKTVREAASTAVGTGPAAFKDNTTVAGVAMTRGLDYLSDLNTLVRAAAEDLHQAARAQAGAATSSLVRSIAALIGLAVVSLLGVVIGARFLTRPLERLADAALRIQRGDFDAPDLACSGPREVASTTETFNEMAFTLRAIEAKTVALAGEDLHSPELRTPLPGQVGEALQAAVDRLAARINEREEQRRQLYDAATFDRLTGLFNRAAVIDYLDHDVARRRQEGETVAVLFVDLDELKQINDRFGHEAGDAAIRVTARALLEATGRSDVVGRLGGDEFLVVLGADESEDGPAIGDKIQREISKKTVTVNGLTLPLRCSVGVALARCDSNTDPMQLMRQADTAMYEAKRLARAERDRLAAATTKDRVPAENPAVA